MKVEIDPKADSLGISFDDIPIGASFYFKMVPEVICIKVGVEGQPYETRILNTQSDRIAKYSGGSDKKCFLVESKLVVTRK